MTGPTRTPEADLEARHAAQRLRSELQRGVDVVRLHQLEPLVVVAVDDERQPLGVPPEQ